MSDVLTDSETIYEDYVRLLNFLNQKVILSKVCVSHSVFYARGGAALINIDILNSLNQKVICSGAGVSLMDTAVGGRS